MFPQEMVKVRGLYVSHQAVQQFPWNSAVFALLITLAQVIEELHPQSTINKPALIGLDITI